jgi:hypothetical protein
MWDVVVVVLASMLAGMPGAAMMLVECTLPRHNNQSNQSKKSGPTKRKANQTSSTNLSNTRSARNGGRVVLVEYACSAKPIGSLTVWPGKPGTADQILDFLVAHSDHLVDCVLFNDHGGDQLVLDDDMVGLGNKLVVTCGKLAETVRQADPVRHRGLWHRACDKLEILASKYWNACIAGWVDQLVKSFLARPVQTHAASWLASQAFLKQPSLVTIDQLDRVYQIGSTPWPKQFLVRVVELARVVNQCLLAFSGSVVAALGRIIVVWSHGCCFDQQVADTIMPGLLANLASQPGKVNIIMQLSRLPQRHSAFLRCMFQQLARSSLALLMSAGGGAVVIIANIVGRIGVFQLELADWLVSSPGLIQYLLDLGSQRRLGWDSLANLAKHYPGQFFDYFVQLGGPTKAAKHPGWLGKLLSNLQASDLAKPSWRPLGRELASWLSSAPVSRKLHGPVTDMLSNKAVRDEFVLHNGLEVLDDRLSKLSNMGVSPDQFGMDSFDMARLQELRRIILDNA